MIDTTRPSIRKTAEARREPTAKRSSEEDCRRIRVFLVCSGVGHVHRGYETFARECFEALVNEPSLDLRLFCGAGKSSARSIVLRTTLPREGKAAQWLGRRTGRGAYVVEEATFFAGLIPYLLWARPDVVFFSDGNIGNMLWHWRRKVGGQFRLLFSNGGPLLPPFPRWDYVQQVNPFHLHQSLEAGETEARNELVPYGFHMAREFRPLSPTAKISRRVELDLPCDRQILLSVGAINKVHKRLDYLVREVARLPQPRPFLVMLGERGHESAEVESLAMSVLGRENFLIGTVAPGEVASYYQVADRFVLASLGEAFGRVLAEAASFGLPCIAHDYEVTRYVLGAEGIFCDMSREGALAEVLCGFDEEDRAGALARRRHADIFHRFSWDSLRPRYVQMINRCVDTNLV